MTVELSHYELGLIITALEQASYKLRSAYGDDMRELLFKLQKADDNGTLKVRAC
jgi:hypothetical protein